MSEAADRPWALLATRNFPPLVGGMEKLNRHLFEAIPTGWERILAGPGGSEGFVAAGSLVLSSPLRPLARFLLGCGLISLREAWRRRRRPGLVLAGSGLTAPIAWFAARLSRARAAAYLHGLDLVAPSRIYQFAWLPFIRRCDLLVANSENTRRLAIARGVPAGRIAVLNPGTEMPPPDAEAGARFRREHELDDEIVLLSVGRLTQRKGLAEFVAQALPKVVSRHPRVRLVIVGEEAVDALHGSRGSERERILAAARAAGVEAQLLFVGRLSQDALEGAYRGSQVHVFPVLDQPGDVEGFGMVALESAARGLPTVAFAVGGVPDAVSDGVTGRLVAPGDYAALAAAVCAQLEADAAPGADCIAFARARDWEAFGRRLRQLLGAPDG